MLLSSVEISSQQCFGMPHLKDLYIMQCVFVLNVEVYYLHHLFSLLCSETHPRMVQVGSNKLSLLLLSTFTFFFLISRN